MPNPLNTVTVPNNYTDACSIQYVYGGKGGTFAITDADVFYQIQYGRLGAEFWTDEAILQPGGGSIEPGAIGVRFRNAVSGVIATVSARISPPGQPGLTQGFAAVAASTMITGVIPALGVAPTAGTGFSYTHTNGTGVYVFTFSTAFSAAPLILTTIGPEAAADRGAIVTVRSTTGFTVTCHGAGGIGDDAFMFVAMEVI